jgi:hypothetical protein
MTTVILSSVLAAVLKRSIRQLQQGLEIGGFALRKGCHGYVAPLSSFGTPALGGA